MTAYCTIFLSHILNHSNNLKNLPVRETWPLQAELWSEHQTHWDERKVLNPGVKKQTNKSHRYMMSNKNQLKLRTEEKRVWILLHPQSKDSTEPPWKCKNTPAGPRIHLGNLPNASHANKCYSHFLSQQEDLLPDWTGPVYVLFSVFVWKTENIKGKRELWPSCWGSEGSSC